MTKIVDESAKIKKSRNKLIKQLKKIDQLITQEALNKKALEIHNWIARHANYRIILKSKNISLFDENKNTAKLSKYVLETLNKLENNNSKAEPLIKKVDIPSTN